MPAERVQAFKELRFCGFLWFKELRLKELDVYEFVRYSNGERGGVRVIVAHATNDSCGGIATGGQRKSPPR